MRKKVKYAAVLSALLLAAAAAGLSCAGAEPVKSGPHPEVRLSAWSAYWDDASSAAEYRGIRRHLSSLSAFAASYGPDDVLTVPEETQRALKQAQKDGKETYLTVVNDSRDDLGRSVEKDAVMTSRILCDDASRIKQAEAMVDAAKKLGAAGVELDFERVFKDAKLQEDYLHFTYQLSLACTRAGLKLRIVLEPSAPFDAPFAKGPEYVVMLYNLHGLHNGPGPKADGAFIRKTVSRMADLPSKKSVAIATGGCIWQDYRLLGLSRGATRFLSSQEAAALAKEKAVPVTRDEASGVLQFSYEEDKHHYEVWYADAETVNAWITEVAGLGISDVSIWRLGSNGDEMIRDIHP